MGILDFVKLLFTNKKEEAAKKLMPVVKKQVDDMVAIIENYLAEIPAEEPKPTIYVVKSGDYLSKIAKEFGVNLQELIAVNNISNPNLIHPGQELVIPSPKPIPEPPIEKSLRCGIWGINGQGSQEIVDKMHSWNPTAITCIFDHIGNNGDLYKYKQDNPNNLVIIRFIHPKNWQSDIKGSAERYAAEIVSKWPVIEPFDYVYITNEINLHYENGDKDAGNQELYQSPEFYKQHAEWFEITAAEIKNKIPEFPLISGPLAYGHNEDGDADIETGIPKLGWSGYGFLKDAIEQYCDNVIATHYYWGHGGGKVHDWLHHSEESTWHAFRWKRVFKLFENYYGIKVKIIIDECGGFNAGKPGFVDDIIYYTTECLKDERILAVTPFLWFDSTHQNGKFPNGNMLNDWWYNSSKEDLNNLVERLKVL